MAVLLLQSRVNAAVADALGVIGFVRAQSPRTPAFATARPLYLNATCEQFKLGRHMCLTSKQQDTEWYARAITQQVEFARETSFWNGLEHGSLVRLLARFFPRSSSSTAGTDRGAINPPYIPNQAGLEHRACHVT